MMYINIESRFSYDRTQVINAIECVPCTAYTVDKRSEYNYIVNTPNNRKITFICLCDEMVKVGKVNEHIILRYEDGKYTFDIKFNKGTEKIKEVSCSFQSHSFILNEKDLDINMLNLKLDFTGTSLSDLYENIKNNEYAIKQKNIKRFYFGSKVTY
jgi:hypothetical protein